MAASPGIMQSVDLLNVLGLILIGLSLFSGFLVRWSLIAGADRLIRRWKDEKAHTPVPSLKECEPEQAMLGVKKKRDIVQDCFFFRGFFSTLHPNFPILLPSP